MPFIARGGSADVVVPSGQSIIVGSLGAGTTTISKLLGGGNFPASFVFQQYLSQASVTLGPFTNGATFRINGSLACDIEYEVGVSPTLTAGGGGGGTGTVKSVAGHSPDGTGNVNIQRSDLTDDASLEAALASIPTQAPQVNAVPALNPGNTYNAATNTPAWTPDSAPTDGVLRRSVTVGGTMTIGGVATTLYPNDDIIWNGTTTTVARGIPSGAGLLKVLPDGSIQLAAAGVDYRPPNLVQSGMGIFLPPSGSTITANGAALTLPVALDLVYAHCFMMFNANEIGAGIPAGRYYVEMSDTQHGTIYNNTYTPGTGLPTVPATKVPFTTNGGGTTAGTTTLTSLLGATMSADYLGANGKVRFSGTGRWNNSAGNKQLSAVFGGTTISFTLTAGTTTIGGSGVIVCQNAASKTAQFAYPEAGSPSSSALSTSAVDTTQAQLLTISGKTSVATDWVGLVIGSIEAIPAA